MHDHNNPLKFGIFMAPFHAIGENPTLALERDLDTVVELDRLGYDEAWFGEHHSLGREIIGDPCLFIAAAAQRTRTIRLGTGVLSLPYHHPFIVADRMVQLDHMTRGRAMLGAGPGALASDAYMMGVDPVMQRERMNEALTAIMALLRSREPVSMETSWFRLQDARLQLQNYTQPHLPVAVAAIFTPSGPTAAGNHGIGLLSVAGVDHDDFGKTWTWAAEAAARSGQTIHRSDWRIVLPIHIAETREKALDQVRRGYERRAYFGDVHREPPPPGENGNSGGGDIVGRALGLTYPTLEAAIEARAVIVGSPDDAIEAILDIDRLGGGVGGVLGLAHEWASTPDTLHSFELFARQVVPHFRGQIETIRASAGIVEQHAAEIYGTQAAAFGKAFTDAGKEVPASLRGNS